MELAEHISKTKKIIERIDLLEDLVSILLQNAPVYSSLTAGFVQPSAGSQVEVDMETTDWVVANQLVQIWSNTGVGAPYSGYYRVEQVVSSTRLLLELQPYGYNTSPAGTVMPSGARASLTSGQPNYQEILEGLLTGDYRNISVPAGQAVDWATITLPVQNRAIEIELRMHIPVLGFIRHRSYLVIRKSGEAQLYAVQHATAVRENDLAGGQSIDVALNAINENQLDIDIDGTNLTGTQTAHTRLNIRPYSDDTNPTFTFS